MSGHVTPKSVHLHSSQSAGAQHLECGSIGKLNSDSIMRCSQTNKVDWVVWMAVFLGTIFAGVEIGIGIGVGLSILVLLLKVRHPFGILESWT